MLSFKPISLGSIDILQSEKTSEGLFNILIDLSETAPAQWSTNVSNIASHLDIVAGDTFIICRNVSYDKAAFKARMDEFDSLLSQVNSEYEQQENNQPPHEGRKDDDPDQRRLDNEFFLDLDYIVKHPHEYETGPDENSPVVETPPIAGSMDNPAQNYPSAPVENSNNYVSVFSYRDVTVGSIDISNSRKGNGDHYVLWLPLLVTGAEEAPQDWIDDFNFIGESVSNPDTYEVKAFKDHIEFTTSLDPNLFEPNINNVASIFFQLESTHAPLENGLQRMLYEIKPLIDKLQPFINQAFGRGK